MSTAQAVAICRPSWPGADIWQRMGGRVWMPGSEGVRMNGLAGTARPNHAQKALTKEVVQLLLQLLPSPPSPWQLQEKGGTSTTRSAEGKPGKHVRR